MNRLKVVLEVEVELENVAPDLSPEGAGEELARQVTRYLKRRERDTVDLYWRHTGGKVTLKKVEQQGEASE